MALCTLTIYKTEGKHRGSFNLENRSSDLTVFLLATFPALKSVCSASKVSLDDAFDYTIFAITICMVHSEPKLEITFGNSCGNLQPVFCQHQTN